MSPTPPPTAEENATPIYGIRSPKPGSLAYLLGTHIGHTADDLETVLTEFGLAPVVSAAVVVASSQAARDAHWGTPANATARRALQDLGATTIRTDLGYTERYFAGLTDGGANPGGRAVAGWEPDDVAQRQLDTANSTVRTITQIGQGKIVGNGTTTLTEAVTFPVAFSGVPVILAGSIGYRAAGAFNLTGLSSATTLLGLAQSASPTGFSVVILQTTGGTLSSAQDWYYNWVAVGVPA